DQQQQQQQQQQEQQGKDQQQQQGGQKQNRRENDTPDLVQQPQQGEQRQPGEQQQQGEHQQQPQPSGDPQGGREQITPGENRQGKAPPEGEAGPGNPGQGSESWGELQPYLNSLKNRGSPPKVPPKYRKYWEAYLKNRREAGKEGGGK
ncbi:MAG: hypothetical protein KDC98_22975, partial [Planctomycetes bacterium]|nr:hypothetical protein [Planctomycetota bacterium]